MIAWVAVLLGSISFLYAQNAVSHSTIQERLSMFVPKSMLASAIDIFVSEESTPLKSEEEYRNDGLYIHSVHEGAGRTAEDGKKVTIHYNIATQDGMVLQDTRTEDAPATFTLRNGFEEVIPGLAIGMYGMKEGGVRTIVVPPMYAYGDSKIPGVPEGGSLVFTVELIEVK